MELPVNYSRLKPYEKREVREEYISLQDGNCYYCGNPLDKEPPPSVAKKKVNKSLFPDGFFRWPVHLHHSHDSNMTIGAVHNYCNAVLWQFHGE